MSSMYLQTLKEPTHFHEQTVTGDISLEIIKSDLSTFVTRFSAPSESLMVWNVS